MTKILSSGLILVFLVTISAIMLTMAASGNPVFSKAGPFQISIDLGHPYPAGNELNFEKTHVDHDYFGYPTNFTRFTHSSSSHEPVIVLVVYDKNVTDTDLRDISSGDTDNDLIPPGGGYNPDFCITEYTEQFIDGKKGIVMKCACDQNHDWIRYAAAFYVTPNVVCFLRDGGNNEAARADFVAVLKSIHIVEELPLAKTVASLSNVETLLAGPFKVSFDMGSPHGEPGIIFTEPREVSREIIGYPPYIHQNGIAVKNITGYTNFTEFCWSVKSDIKLDIILDIHEKNVTNLLSISTADGKHLKHDDDSPGNYTERLIDGKKGIVMEATNGLSRDPAFSQPFGVYAAAFYVTPNIICVIHNRGSDIERAKADFYAVVDTIHVELSEHVSTSVA